MPMDTRCILKFGYLPLKGYNQCAKQHFEKNALFFYSSPKEGTFFIFSEFILYTTYKVQESVAAAESEVVRKESESRVRPCANAGAVEAAARQRTTYPPQNLQSR